MATGGESSIEQADERFQDVGKDPALVPADIGGQLPVSLRLLGARQKLGLSAKDVASRTRITLRHIEALEAGDYNAMPGRPYAIGFAKAYARAVGLADGDIAEMVRSELEGGTPRPEPKGLNQFEVGDPAKTPSRMIGWLALLLVGAVLAMGAVLWRSYYAPAVSLPSLISEPAVPSAALTQRQVQAGARLSSQPIANGPVVFTALEEGIWVKFYDSNGKQLMQKQLSKGESYTLPADAFKPLLWTGRPDALAIAIGGKPLPRLAEAEGVMKDVPIDATSLKARLSSPPAVAGASLAPTSASTR